MTTPTYDLIEYAFYNDGSEAGSTIIGTSNNQQTLTTDITYLFRVQIHNDNNKVGNATWTFEFNHAGGGWTDVTTTAAPVQAVDSASLTEGEDCTNRLTGQGANFIANNNGVTEDGTATLYSHIASDYSEQLLAFQIPAAQVTDGDEILIRARESGAGRVVTYTVTGDIDVNEPAAAGQPTQKRTQGVPTGSGYKDRPGRWNSWISNLRKMGFIEFGTREKALSLPV
jgi:hypothetical protein